MDPYQVWLSNAKGQQGPCFPLRLVLGRLPSSVSALTADEVDGAVVMLREHAPQGIDSGFEASPVAVDSPRPRPRTRPPLRPRPSSWFTRPCPPGTGGRRQPTLRAGAVAQRVRRAPTITLALSYPYPSPDP